MKKKIIFTIVILIFGISIGYAAEMILGKDVSFSNGKTNLKANNIQDAMDELYNKTINEVSCKNISKPNLGENNLLIPVTIDSDGTVTYISEDDESWYNYCDKRWANAVILEDEKTYKAGDTIKEEDIESYFVWIPKYKYKLWNTGTASKNSHEIEIVFDENNTTDIEGYSCETPLVSGETGNCDNGEYMTHPAFITMNTNGFWVGKFETGYRGSSSVTSAQVNKNESESVIIKPNVYSWTNITVYNAFLSSYNYIRELDSHMMKNTEWGAVAYLSHSKYGTNNEININNNSSCKTGYSSLANISQQTYPGNNGDGESYNKPYNTSDGYLASTTGNITGIYDMAGGGFDSVAAYVDGNFGSSGFTSTTIHEYDSKYFDVYSSNSTITSYNNRILGDATGEMGPFISTTYGSGSFYVSSWYGNISHFVTSSSSWFYRGGSYRYGIGAKIFSFMTNKGVAETAFSFRIVLTP